MERKKRKLQADADHDEGEQDHLDAHLRVDGEDGGEEQAGDRGQRGRAREGEGEQTGDVDAEAVQVEGDVIVDSPPSVPSRLRLPERMTASDEELRTLYRGYDPLFEVVECHRTFGELAPAVKSVLSHRARAVMQAKEILHTLSP